ncbi:hypothetical protein TCAL_04468 [Tigriopus californicus]|uniref:DZF domain-containing protein n=2 Tax=Tigriopus californicus TaxID=6832 RepID=A0A553NZ74_TIGCA|nr:hypothetical protein TCAL_04468 [Tigriopus californicus]|eukprot:TCALIF_04468-PA protein Name:"Similar to ZFR Zinc finger RNA-binding protein (Pongo abelii)" AED:0.07 eAED:0.07 QI:0/-1/0/1/-1/1/1/0/1027
MAANNFFGYPAPPHATPTYSAPPNPAAAGYAPGPPVAVASAPPTGVPPSGPNPAAVAYNAASVAPTYRAAPAAVVAYSAYQPPHQSTVSYAAAPVASVAAPPTVTASYPVPATYGQYPPPPGPGQPVYDPSKQAAPTYNHPYPSNVGVTVSYSVSDPHYQARPVYSNNSTVNVVARPAVINAPRPSYTTYAQSSSTSSYTYGAAPAPMAGPPTGPPNQPKANIYLTGQPNPPAMGLAALPPGVQPPPPVAKVGPPHWIRAQVPPGPLPGPHPPRILAPAGLTHQRAYKPRVAPKPQQLHYCEVCKISCAGPQTYKEHLEGQKHKKKEAALKTGSHGPSTRSGSALRCELCDVTCTGSDAYAAHIRGSKHQKVVKLHTKLGKPIPSVDPVLVTKSSETESVPANTPPVAVVNTSSNAGPAKTVHLAAATAPKPVPVPKITFVGAHQAKTEPEISKSGHSSVLQNEVTIPRLPDEKDIQPVGHDYIEEIKSDDGKITSFNCKLCDCKFNDPNAKEMHMKGRRHRLQYKKKVNPDLVVDIKPSLRQRKIAEERAKRCQAREEFWKRREEEFKMLEEEERAFWEERRRFEEENGGLHDWHRGRFPGPRGSGPMPPRFGPHMFGFPPMMRRPDTIEDRHVNAKHSQIYPNDPDLELIRSLVNQTEKALKMVSDELAVAEGQADSKTGKVEKPDPNAGRDLKGVMRVGILAKGLILNGDHQVRIVVLCGKKPTSSLLDKVVNLLPGQMAKLSTDVEYTLEKLMEKAGFTLTTKKDMETTKKKAILEVTLTSPLIRDEASPSSGPDPEDLLDLDVCKEALAALRHAKWFQARAAQLHSAVTLIRVLRHLFSKVPAWQPINLFTLELLVEKCLASVGGPLSPGDGFRRVFEALASGILYSDSPGFLDPCEREPRDTAANLTPQQREDIASSAQHALRLIAFRQVHKVLCMEALPPPKSGARRFTRKRRLDESSTSEMLGDEESGEKKDKKETGASSALGRAEETAAQGKVGDTSVDGGGEGSSKEAKAEDGTQTE